MGFRPRESTMRRSLWIAAMLGCLGGFARADGVDLSMKPKAIAAAIGTKSAATAPYAAGRDGWPDLAALEQVPAAGYQSACDRSQHVLCYDAAEGRLVYRGGRDYMPRIGELRPESVSLRRNRLVFRYSF
jgi:hypothetical protein